MSKKKSVGNSFSRKRQNLYYSPQYATCVGCCCPPISKYDAVAIDKEVARLILDDDVTNKRGIYPYFFTRKENFLSLRAFSDAQKLAAYERQRGLCARCAKEFKIEKMEADHITGQW